MDRLAFLFLYLNARATLCLARARRYDGMMVEFRFWRDAIDASTRNGHLA